MSYNKNSFPLTENGEGITSADGAKGGNIFVCTTEGGCVVDIVWKSNNTTNGKLVPQGMSYDMQDIKTVTVVSGTIDIA